MGNKIKSPDIDDFKRMIDGVLKKHEHNGLMAGNRVIEKGSLSNSRLVFILEEAIASHHQDGINEIMKISALYYNNHNTKLDDLLNTIIPYLSNFTEILFDKVRRHSTKNSFRAEDNPALPDVEGKFKKRMDDAIKDFRVGYVGCEKLLDDKKGLVDFFKEPSVSAFKEIISENIKIIFGSIFTLVVSALAYLWKLI